MPLITPRLSEDRPQFIPTAIPRLTGQPDSPYPYQCCSSHGYTTSAVVLPSKPQLRPFHNPYHLHLPSFISTENHGCTRAVSESSFDTLFLLFSGLEPIHKLMQLLAKVVENCLYRLENFSAQLFGSQKTRIDKKLRHFSEVAKDLLIFDGSFPTALLKYLRKNQLVLASPTN